ncbi:MAG: molybdopterin-binding protein [Peptococcaceae bacterium]|nr:molybdopterin-binding protein [Peptococcaceae bacterium]
MRKVPVTEAVGMVLCHDITRIIPGREKGRAFRRGQVITPGDIPTLLDLGKEHIYVWETGNSLIHEDEAALSLARHAAGPGLKWDQPSQGRVNLRAAYDGLLKVHVKQLNKLNNTNDVVMATAHNNRYVKEGQIVAATRITPLAVHSDILKEAERICTKESPLLEVKPFQSLWLGVVTTGSEIYSGRIRDGFCSIIRQKTAVFGAKMLGQVIVPDDPHLICAEVRQFVAEGAQMVLVTGGMSVDPDDVTPVGIRATGAEVVSYGAPALPGAMFMLAYLGRVPICGLPGCVMFNGVTIFDLVLPRIFAGERISREEIVSLGHGGLCAECTTCHYPACSFGK